MNTNKRVNNFDLIFHLGYPKCASTTLQDVVFPLTTGYSGSGSGKQKNDHYAKEFFALSPSGPSVTSSLKQAEIWAKKVLEFRQNEFPDVNRLILSSEYYIIHNIFKARPIIPFLRNFKDKIWSHGDIKIILVIRNQADRIASLYAEESKGNPKASQKDFEKYCRRMTKSKKRIENMYYSNCIEELYEAFGKDKVCILLMEDIRKIDFWEKLKKFAELPEFNPKEMLKGPKANKKKSGSSTWKIQDYDFETRARTTVNTYFSFLWPGFVAPKIRIKAKELSRFTLKIFYTKKRNEEVINEKNIYLSEDVKGSIKSCFKESNEKLSKLLDRDLKPLGYL